MRQFLDFQVRNQEASYFPMLSTIVDRFLAPTLLPKKIQDAHVNSKAAPCIPNYIVVNALNACIF
jgi:hypothetical protein